MYYVLDMKKQNNIPFNNLHLLPPEIDLETKAILKKTINANRELAKLEGYSAKLPNKNILLNSIVLNEAIASSEIENIITTQDKLYTALASNINDIDPATKEVLSYREAVWTGYNLIKNKKILSTNIILKIQEMLLKNNAGVRKLPGTVLKNDRTGEVIYAPPDNEETIKKLLGNLEKYINADKEHIDPLIKLAVIHYQFESIHPFYDGNGRTGRIINVLYLIVKDLLEEPILYLSKYIIKHKNLYYQYLQEVRTKNNWEAWILFMLDAIQETSKETIIIIQKIMGLLNDTLLLAKKRLPKTVYSKELVEILFIQPYTKIEHLVNQGIAERRTASKYLKELENIGILKSFKLWKENIFVNVRLYELLKSI